MREYFLIGKTLKSHGTSGQLRIRIDDKFLVYVLPDTFVFLDLDGSKVPYRITAYEEGPHHVIKLEDVDNKQVSDALAGKDIWIPIEQVKEKHLKSPANIKQQWSDYSLYDAHTQTAYKIIRTEEYPQQLMAVIRLEEKELLIPLHEQLITEIDREKKIIFMQIPEGLLGL